MRFVFILIIILLLNNNILSLLRRETKDKKQPHLVLILADDYGWANVGYHRKKDDGAYLNGEILTPNIDHLANKYTKLERFYAYKICSPSRSSIQTGRLPVHVNVLNKPPETVNPDDPVSGFAGIPRKMTGIAKKLKNLGYKTHMTGKWDAGMATPEHTPIGRGYDSFFGYFHHANDYWTTKTSITAIGEIDICHNKFNDLWKNNGPSNLAGSAYEEELFTQNTLQIIQNHNVNEPLFLFHAFHLLHTPLQVPEVWKEPFKNIEHGNRKKYAAMVWYMDHVIGNIVAALHNKDMWDNTFLLFISDNGGPIYNPGSANNYPLRAGKFSDMEGGVRVNSFCAGGVVPDKLHGKEVHEYMHISDIYTTFIAAAGGNDDDMIDKLAEEYNLPPVDGLNLWPLLQGKTSSSPRNEIHLSENALIKGDYKLVTGDQPQDIWTGEFYPNKTGKQPIVPDKDYVPFTLPGMFIHKCDKLGCLFNIKEDPTEHNDLSKEKPELYSSMLSRLNELNKNNFNPVRGEPSKVACDVAKKRGGTYGPFIDLEFDVINGNNKVKNNNSKNSNIIIEEEKEIVEDNKTYLQIIKEKVTVIIPNYFK